jgi:glutathione S-transferase
MIDLYTWTTPNGRKVSIMLEEIGLPYNAIAVELRSGAQFEPRDRYRLRGSPISCRSARI